MRTCDVKSSRDGKVIACTLPIGHGGVHANRVGKERVEVSTVGKGVRKDHPTMIYETKYTWADGQIAVTHKVAS